MRWWLVFASLQLASASSGGAGQCDAESGVPQSMGGSLSNTGWSVSVNGGFTISSPVTVTVNGPAGLAFNGIQMYVEDASSNTKYGSWAAKTGYQASSVCPDGPAFTHTSSANKAVPVNFIWNAPAFNPGVSTLSVRVLLLTQPTPNRTWAQLTTSVANLNTQAPSSPPTTNAPTSVPTTSAPSTSAPSSAAPTMAPTCSDGLLGPTEVGVDCGGPCPACPTYVWLPQEWTPCSVPCGGGIQTRSVKCVDGATGAEVSSANCTAAHDAETSINCNPDPCPKYSWQIGAWEACSSPCNTGNRIRSVVCISDVGNVTVADVNCGAVTKPDQLEDCNTDPCVQARWVSQPWAPCSVTCGGGTQTRTVGCLDKDNNPTLETACAIMAPPTQQSCNNETCGVYVWNPCPEYYPCTATCNGGTGMLGVRYKDVFCMDLADRQTVDSTLCDPTTKPRTNFTSCNPQACTDYNWMANSNWGPCEQSLDPPFKYFRKREFHCHSADGSVALNTYCKGVSVPVGSLECTPNTCLKVPTAVSGSSSTKFSLLLASLFILWI